MIVITAPTSNIGRQVLADVLAGGQPVRVIARDPAKLPADIRDQVEVVQGSHGDPDVVTHAFAGADSLFWLAPPNPRAASLDRSTSSSPGRRSRPSPARASSASWTSPPSAAPLRTPAGPVT